MRNNWSGRGIDLVMRGLKGCVMRSGKGERDVRGVEDERGGKGVM